MIDPSMRQALQAIKERDGIGQSEQVRRALAVWIEKKGIKLKRRAKKRSATEAKS